MTKPPQFIVEVVKFPPQIPVGLAEPVLPHPMVAAGALGLVIYGNPLPQISENLMN